MEKAFKLVLLLVNALLSVYYIISSFYFWEEMNNWYSWNKQSTWAPFWVYPHSIPDLPTVAMPVFKTLNRPFVIFCMIIVTNCIMLIAYYFFIPRIQRWASKDV